MTRLSGLATTAALLGWHHSTVVSYLEYRSLALNVRQELDDPAVERGRVAVAVGHQLDVGAGVVVDCQADLLEVVGAFGPGGRLPDLLYGREQQANQDGDDGHHDE